MNLVSLIVSIGVLAAIVLACEVLDVLMHWKK